MVSGGFIEATFTHPILGSGNFEIKDSEAGSLEPGGYRTEDNDDDVGGQGTQITKKVRKLGSFEAVILGRDGDLQKLNDLAASSAKADWTFEHVGGDIWGGNGAVVGEVKQDYQAGTIPLKITAPIFKLIS
jgi:hypothetical protein